MRQEHRGELVMGKKLSGMKGTAFWTGDGEKLTL